MCANFPEKDNKLHFNGCSDRKLVLNDPSAFGVIYLHDYFHNCTYFIEFIMTFFSKTLKLVVTTLTGGAATSLHTWHQHMGHMSYAALKAHGPSAIKGMDFGSSTMDTPTICHGCELSKSTSSGKRKFP